MQNEYSSIFSCPVGRRSARASRSALDRTFGTPRLDTQCPRHPNPFGTHRACSGGGPTSDSSVRTDCRTSINPRESSRPVADEAFTFRSRVCQDAGNMFLLVLFVNSSMLFLRRPGRSDFDPAYQRAFGHPKHRNNHIGYVCWINLPI